MSQENVQVVRRHFAAFKRGGVDAVEKFWHPDIEWRPLEGAADDVGLIRGRDALRRYHQAWIDATDGLGADADEVVAEAGEKVVVVVRNSGLGRASGVLTKGRYYVACIVQDGRMANGREYETRDRALEAVDLRE
jgi:ketosteroid isomerase-like protein